MNSKANQLNKKAAVLKYNRVVDQAPRLVAKGKGILAEKIIELAKTHGIPIVENPDLLKILMDLDENQYIPERIFRLVAEIYAFIIKLDESYENSTH